MPRSLLLMFPLSWFLFCLKFSSVRVKAFCITTFKPSLQFHLFCEASSDCHFCIYMDLTFSAQFPVPLSYSSTFFSSQRSFCLLAFHIYLCSLFMVFSSQYTICCIRCFILFYFFLFAVGVPLGTLGLPVSSSLAEYLLSISKTLGLIPSPPTPRTKVG